MATIFFEFLNISGMNAVIISLTVLLIMILFILVLMFFQIEKQKNSRLDKILKSASKEYNLFIHYKDVLNKKFIGLDNKNKKLLLLNLNNNDQVKACVPIDEIESCSIGHLKDEQSGHTRKVFLELICKDDHERIRFCFYNESYDDVNDKPCLLLKARYWNQRINFYKNYWWVNAHEYVT